MKFRILMIAPTPFFSDRGTHIRIFEEAKALEEQGHTVAIVTYHLGGDPFLAIEGKPRNTVLIHRIPRLLFWYQKREAGASWQKIFLDLLLLFKTLAVAARVHPDILHGHLHEGALIGWIVKKLLFWKNIKLVGDFHSTLTAEMISDSHLRWKPSATLFQKIEGFISILPDACIASAKTLADALEKKRNNVTLVFDGVDDSSYEHLPSAEDCRHQFNLPPHLPIIVYTGQMLPNKGIELLFLTILDVLKQTSRVHFVLAGFPTARAETFVREHDLGLRVTIISPLRYRDLPTLLRASTIAVDPKHDAGVGQASGKILHYMAAGLPVVCLDTPMNRMYLGDGGKYVSSATSREFAEILADLLHHADEQQRLGDINRKRCERFSSRAAAQKIEEVYRILLAQPKHHR